MQECDHRLARGTGSSGEETVVTRGRCCWGMAHCTPTPHHTHHLIRSAGPHEVTCYSYMLHVSGEDSEAGAGAGPGHEGDEGDADCRALDNPDIWTLLSPGSSIS